jgi:hypothetical protein
LSNDFARDRMPVVAATDLDRREHLAQRGAVRRLAAHRNPERDIARSSQDLDLPHERQGKICIVSDQCGQARPLRERGLHELERDLLGVARAAAVAHRQHPSALAQAALHRVRALHDPLGVLGNAAPGLGPEP